MNFPVLRFHVKKKKKNFRLRPSSAVKFFLGDLYRIYRESSGADSQSGGRSSARSDLFVDASLANDPGFRLPPVFASDFSYLVSKIILKI